MNIPETIKTAIFTVLSQVFGNNQRADEALRHVLRANRSLAQTERGRIAEASYDIIRKWRWLWACLDQQPNLSSPVLEKLLNTYFLLQDGSASRRSLSSEDKKILARAEKLQNIRRLRESLPDWLDELGEKELGERWDAVLHALNEKPSVVLRVNTLKTTKDKLALALNKQHIGFSSVPWAKDALVLHNHANVFEWYTFYDGHFERQDAASQMVAELARAEPGMRVVDACAGAGGKTLHLAALMQNRGRIIAMDVNEKKLLDLRRRAARAGADIVETRAIVSSQTIKRLKKTAHRVIVDAPCSGLGSLKRNPDIKWRLQPQQLERLLSQQHQILSSNSRMVQVGGLFVYAVCSVLPSEGEKQIESFLQDRSQEFRLIEERRFWPDVDGFDGFYIAVMERTG